MRIPQSYRNAKLILAINAALEIDIPEKVDAFSPLFRYPGGRRSVLPLGSALHRGRSGYRHHHGACSEQAGRQTGWGRAGGLFIPWILTTATARPPTMCGWLGWNEYHIHTSERLTAAEIPIAIVQGRPIVFSPGCERDHFVCSFILRKLRHL